MATTIIRSGSKATIIMSGQGVPGPSGATASHWVTHKDGGIDEGKVEELATAGTIGSVPTSDGAGGLTMSVPAGGGNVTSPGGETAGRLAEFTGVNSIDETAITTSSVSTHLASTTNPHSTSIANLGSGTLAQFNTALSSGGPVDVSTASRPPSGAASGDLSSSYPGPTVSALQGTAVSAVAPTAGQVLTEVGGVWTATAPTGGVTDHGALTGLADDDHTQYQLRTEKDAASGYAGLNGSSKLTGSQQVYGSASDTATEGDDTRVPSQGENDALVGTDGTPSTSNKYVTNSDARNTDSRAPNGSATGDLTGSYPGPVVSAVTVTGPTQKLTIGAVADGQFLSRSGTTLIGSTPGGSGDVVGPASAVDGNIPLYDGATGKLIKDGGFSLPEANLITGILSGYVVTINADPAKFDVSAGTGVVIDWTAAPANQITPVASGPFVAQVLPDITEAFTEIFIDAAGAVQAFSGASATPQQLRSLIRLRDVNHANGVSIIAFGEAQRLAFEGTQSILDYIDKLGPISVGNKATPAATDLTVGKTAGVTTMPFFNASVDKQDPTNAVNAAIGVINPVIYSFQDGSGGFAFDFTNTEIDPDIFDDGTGTLTTMAGNRYAVQRFAHFSSSNVTLFFVPQFDYSSLAAAIAAVNAEGFNLGFDGTRGVITTLIAIKGNTTDLTNTSSALFVSVSGAGGGGGAGGATTYLGLNDTTDSSYVGKAGQVSMVNTGETGLDLTQIDHTDATHITGVGSNTHAQIDTHIAAVAPHTGVLDLAGTRVMTGNLQMGAQAITNAGNVTLADGVLSQSTAGAGTTAVASWAALGSSGGAHQLFSTDVDPNTVVTGNPGDWLVRADGADSRTYQHRGTGASNTDWVEVGAAVAGGGGGLFGSIWRFDDDVTASDPASGRFKYNNASPPSVTIVRQHEIDRGGADRTNYQALVDTDDFFYAQEETTGDRSDLFKVVSKVTQTNHVDFTVTHVASGPSLIRNNRDCLVGFQVVLDHTHAHSDLTGVTSDQHHPQVHTIVSHDTTATGANLTTLTDGSNADALHVHAGGGNEFEDDVFRVIDEGDNTKKIAFQVSGLTTATVRTITMPDKDLTLDDDGDSRPPDAHTIAFHSDTSATGAELDTLTDNSNADSLHTHGDFADNTFRIQDNGDPTKEMAFQVSGVTTSTIRTVTMPDKNLTLDDIADSRPPAAHTIVSHSDTTATGAELDTLTDGSDANGLHIHSLFTDSTWRLRDNSDLTKQIAFQASGITTATVRTITMPDKNLTLDDIADTRTPAAHTIAFHSDTSATGAELDTLTDGSNADALHSHSGVGNEFDDALFRVFDNGDNTKKIAFQVSGVTTATTRTITVPDADITIDDDGASRPPNGSATGDLGGSYPSPTVVALQETGDPVRLTIAAVAPSAILQRSGTTIIATILGADLIQRDGSVNYTGNQNFGNNSITNVNLVDAVDVNLVASRTHFWGLTINGPLTAAKSNEQLLVLPFDCTITEIVVIALTTITTGDFTFRVQCGPDDESYVGGDLVGAAVTLDNSNKKIRSGGAISFAALEDDRLSVDVTAATGTQPDTDHDANFNVMVYYTRPIS